MAAVSTSTDSGDDPTHRRRDEAVAVGREPAPISRLAGFGLCLVALLLVVLLSACNGAGASDEDEDNPASTEPTAAKVSEGGTDTAVTSVTADDPLIGPCADDILTVGELARVDAVWTAKAPEIAATATTWAADAQLTQLSATCFLFDQPEIFSVFYSPSARTWLVGLTEADTGPDLGEIDPDTISFARLQTWLIDAGYAADLVVDDIDITTSFAPEGDDSGAPYARVLVADGGATYYVDVNTRDGSAHRTEL